MAICPAYVFSPPSRGPYSRIRINSQIVLVDDDGRACIADFGLSTLLTQLSGSTFATTRQGKGTARWMAPELLDLEDESQAVPTTQTDVYSFGSVMLQVCNACAHFCCLSSTETTEDFDREYPLSLSLSR